MYVKGSSLLTADVPADWRTATMCPSFKKGDRESASNYGAVSLTSIILKVMVSVMKEAVMNHLLRTAVLSYAQHDFVPKRSCLTNLLVTEQWVTKFMDTREPVDVAFLDYARAFIR